MMTKVQNVVAKQAIPLPIHEVIDRFKDLLAAWGIQINLNKGNNSFFAIQTGGASTSVWVPEKSTVHMMVDPNDKNNIIGLRIEGEQDQQWLIQVGERIKGKVAISWKFLGSHPPAPSQRTLAVTEDWYSTPDEMGEDWWADFERELQENRLTFD